MIRLLKIELHNHPFLKNMDIPLIDLDEVKDKTNPYTTVVIGNNGTGKSQILKIITEIFRTFQGYQNKSDGRFPSLKYGFNIAFLFYHNVYEIDSSKLTLIRRKGESRIYDCYKYPSIEIYDQVMKKAQRTKPNENSSVVDDVFINNLKKENFGVHPKELELPSKILASAIMLNDRFVHANSNSPDFYQYLGPRRAPNALSTMGFIRKIVRFLFDASKNEKFKERLGKVLENLNFKKLFVVEYYPRYKKYIYQKEDFSVDDLHYFFTKWREIEAMKRDKKRELWGFGHYNAIKADDEKLRNITKLINFISSTARLKDSDKKAKYFKVDVFEADNWELLFYLDDLIKLDLIHLENVYVSKLSDRPYLLQEISSGEYNILFSMLAMFSRIEANSIVLIDEPEISLHPNWQMSYVDQLKTVFQDFSTCHFIIASHSHFIVSDLEGNSSSVIALSRTDDERKNKVIKAELIKANTYGWSAEEVLYSVFNVRTSRNYFMEYDLNKLIAMINQNSSEYAEIKRICDKMETLVLTEADPLKVIIRKAKEYLDRHD